MRRITALSQGTISRISGRSQFGINTGSSISPLSIIGISHHRNQWHFSSQSKRSKIRLDVDDFADDQSKSASPEEAEDEGIEEATVEKETKKAYRETAHKTITNVRFSEEEDENKSYRSKLDQYIGVNVGLDNILPRMIALKNKNPVSITKTMNTFYIANVLTGIPFFLLCWKCSAYIVYPELIFAYFIIRYTANYGPVNRKLVEFYKLKYPLLSQCNFSRKCPDPTRQSVDAFADNVASKMPILQKVESFLDNNRIVGKWMKNFREKRYVNAIQHGFAWDIADNTRVIIGLPLLFGLMHYGGLGLYISDSEAYNAELAQWICTYIGAAYGARITSNWALRAMTLTTIEKQFGLRNDSGEYFGFTGNKGSESKSAMDQNDTTDSNDSVKSGKLSSRKGKPKRM